jgi:diguanylate cyclase (GGDEF)-like protein/PAS domain S-box-containing protein
MNKRENRFNMNTLWHRLRKNFAVQVVALFLPVALGVIGLATYIYQSEKTKEFLITASHESAVTKLAENSIRNNFEKVFSDLRYLSHNDDFRSMIVEYFSDEKSKRFSENLKSLMQSRKVYDQIRWIDETGRERFRVNYNDGRPAAVRSVKLQNKADRDYFTEAMKLSGDELYFSPFDLNVENGKIAIPRKPTIRIAMPIIDRDGKKRGIFIINYLGNELIDEFTAITAISHGDAMLLNSDGFWMKGVKPDDAWGFMRKRNDLTLAHAYPTLWKRIVKEENGQFADEEGLWTFETIYPLGYAQQIDAASATTHVITQKHDYSMKVLTHIPTQKLYAKTAPLLNNIVASAGFMLIFMGIGSWKYVQLRRRERKSLRSMKKAQAKTNAILEAVPDKYTWANNEGIDFFGEDVIGKEASFYFEGEQETYALVEPLFSGDNNQTIYFESWQRRCDGEKRLLGWWCRTLKHKNGNVKGVLATGRDITDTWEKENQLRMLSIAVEQSTNSIVITDTRGVIEYVNAAFVKTTGYDSDMLIGKNTSILQSGKTPNSTYEELWGKLLLGENWQGEFINRKNDGNEYTENLNISPIRNTDGKVTHYIAIKEDITERKSNEERIKYLAHFDSLTGLPNRAQLNDHLKYILGLAKRNNGRFAVIFLDLDRFKQINDSLGHDVGDLLLIELSRRLQGTLRDVDMVSRLGGDEFIILLPDTDIHGAEHVAQKLLETTAQPFVIHTHELIVTASIGIALYPDDGMDMEMLFKNADTAMYRAKHEGRNNYCFFTEGMQILSERNLQLVNALRSAIERHELHVYYQLQISQDSGKIVGSEALLRWFHPDLGSISPAEFIPIAEESGLILPIGEWVLRTVVRQAKKWIESGMTPMIFAVNLSAIQFRYVGFPELVTSILDEAGLLPEYLELELTESAAMHDPQTAVHIIDDLNARGIRVSIDDFGTGYSSLSYLKKFKVSKLKIDQSFVRDLHTDFDDKAIVHSIITMAHNLGIMTIAEGVETIEQLDFLKEKGCDEIQGYYISKPLPVEEFEKFVEETNQKR